MSEPSESHPEWIGLLAGAVARLGRGQVLALASGLDDGAAPSSGQLQRALSLPTPDAVHLARRLDQVLSSPGMAARDVRTALATIAHMKGAGTPRGDLVEIACTAPTRLGVPLRTTYGAALEMVQAARQEILVVGYVFTEGARALLEQVARGGRERRVRVTVIGNRMGEHLPALRAVWPADCPHPRVFSYEANPRDEMAALHAKLLVCDGATALVTSANFSHHGLHENIEVGVKVESSAVVRIVEFFNSLIVAGHVNPVEWPS